MYAVFLELDKRTPEMDSNIKKAPKQMADDEEHTFVSLLSEWATFQTALQTSTSLLDDEFAFSTEARGLSSWEWYRTWVQADWPHLAWAAKRLLSQPASASSCEHSWSIEGWMHSKKRNRLGQQLVERLVRSHSNMLISAARDWRPADMTWEEECELEEPDAEDEDSGERRSTQPVVSVE